MMMIMACHKLLMALILIIFSPSMLLPSFFIFQVYFSLPLCTAFSTTPYPSKNIIRNDKNDINNYRPRSQIKTKRNHPFSGGAKAITSAVPSFPSFLTTTSLTSTTIQPVSSEISKSHGKLKQLKWMDRYNELKAFYQQNGHMNVNSTSHNGLGQWIITQRSWYKKYTNERGELKEYYKEFHQERLDLLNQIGFVWDSPILSNSKWIIQYNKLRDFYNQNGHMKIKSKSKGLGQWIVNQRVWYKKYTNEKGELKQFNEIYQERIDLLNEIGFVWCTRERGRKIDNSKWMVRYNQLKDFKIQYGHIFVPLRWEQNKQLGPWIFAQREWYNGNTKNGELINPCEIHQERINLMNDIGFVWNPKPGEAFNHQWMNNYNKLKDFHDKYGHFRVTNDTFLLQWVGRQRFWYKQNTNKNGELLESNNNKDNNINNIYQERIDLLNEIGFVWNPISDHHTSSKWIAKYHALQNFQKEFGHVNVPQRWERNKSLGSWVDRQRRAYRDVYTRNDNPEPHQERINLLNEIGFDWSP